VASSITSHDLLEIDGCACQPVSYNLPQALLEGLGATIFLLRKSPFPRGWRPFSGAGGCQACRWDIPLALSRRPPFQGGINFHHLVVPATRWHGGLLRKSPPTAGVDVRRCGRTGWVPFRESFPQLKPIPGLRPSSPSEGNRFHPLVVPAVLARVAP
jgi:hypothetical protein